MSSHYKAFLVVITLAVIVFWLARPVFTKFMADEDYLRRRNLWLGLTVSAFLIPNFWIYMGIATILIYRVARKDPNPAALYLFLMLVIPPVEESIPGLGIVNYLFPLNNVRLLVLIIIVPAIFKIINTHRSSITGDETKFFIAPDFFLLLYCFLQISLYAPYVAASETLRSSLLLFIEVIAPYYFISRFCVKKSLIVEAIAAFTLSSIILAPLAIFETTRGWLMYGDIASYWKVLDLGEFLKRGDILRAQVSAGHSIVLGNFFAVCLGFWLYLQSRLERKEGLAGLMAILAGLVAAFSRGPWVGAVICALIFYATGPNGVARLFRFMSLSLLCVGVILLSPYGDRVVDYLPFIGTVDAGNVTYRQSINDRSWAIIQINPFFGSPYFSSYMEDLRTGLGIIDLLNVYLSIGMAYGLVTMGLFILFFITTIYKCVVVMQENKFGNPDDSMLGAGLIAALSGTLLILYTASNYLSIPSIYMAITALMVGFTRIRRNS